MTKEQLDALKAWVRAEIISGVGTSTAIRELFSKVPVSMIQNAESNLDRLMLGEQDSEEKK